MRMTSKENWKNWNWRSEGDLFLNGAFFTTSGSGAGSSYTKAYNLAAKPSSLVANMTAGAGALRCRPGQQC